jgi:hypothetical protein
MNLCIYKVRVCPVYKSYLELKKICYKQVDQHNVILYFCATYTNKHTLALSNDSLISDQQQKKLQITLLSY